MSGQRVIALLGRPDAPTDGVEEYCLYLGEALLPEDFELIIERVNWSAVGWDRAANALRRRAEEWHGTWVLVQYTALAWSAHGFPLHFPLVLKSLKAAGASVAVGFYDLGTLRGRRVIYRFKRPVQVPPIRQALHPF